MNDNEISVSFIKSHLLLPLQHTNNLTELKFAVLFSVFVCALGCACKENVL